MQVLSGLACCNTGPVPAALDFGILKLGRGPSFILNKKLCLLLDLEAGMLDMSVQHWTALVEASTHLHFSRQILIASGLGCRNIELVTPASDLSFWSWGFDPAPFLITNFACLWTWMPGRWTFQSSIGLVILKLGLQGKFILNKLWELEAGTLDLYSSIGLVFGKLR